MTILATALRQLIAAGVAGDDLVRAVAELEAAMPVRDAAAERRRARDRAYQARRRRQGGRESAESAESARSADAISPNENILTPSLNPDVSDETSSPCGETDFGTEVVTAWNAAVAGTPLPKARALTRDRRRHLAARVREHGRDAVEAAIANMAASDFHSGRSGKWLEGNLGWLLRNPENFARMLERVPPAGTGPPPAIDRAAGAERMAAIYEQQGRGDEARMLRREARLLRSEGEVR